MKVIRLVFEPRFERGYPRSHVEVFETFVDKSTSHNHWTDPQFDGTIHRISVCPTAKQAKENITHSLRLLNSPSRGSFFAKRDDE